MNYPEYALLAERTKAYADGRKVDYLILAALGICGETGEIVDGVTRDANTNHIMEECGDLMWYVALLDSEIACNVDDWYTTHGRRTRGSMSNMIKYSSQIAEMVKKHRYADKPLDEDQLARYASRLMHEIAALADDYDSSISAVMEGNITKLQSRYPNGFKLDSHLTSA